MEKINKELAKYIAITMKHFPTLNLGEVHVVMNSRLTSTAGRAWLESGKLEFSSKLFSENEEVFLKTTVPHELAHIVAYRVYGDKGHGRGWAHVMALLDVPAERLHTYAVPKKGAEYKCSCRVHTITPQRESWMRRGKVYSCKECGTILVKV